MADDAQKYKSLADRYKRKYEEEAQLTRRLRGEVDAVFADFVYVLRMLPPDIHLRVRDTTFNCGKRKGVDLATLRGIANRPESILHRIQGDKGTEKV